MSRYLITVKGKKMKTPCSIKNMNVECKQDDRSLKQGLRWLALAHHAPVLASIQNIGDKVFFFLFALIAF